MVSPLVVYRGQRKQISVGNNTAGRVTFDQGVPTPVPIVFAKNLDMSVWEHWEPGQPASKGRPIHIKLPAQLGYVCWSHQFVKLVRERYPTCPIVLFGASENFSILFKDIPNCVWGSDKRAKDEKPYRDFNLASGGNTSSSRGILARVRSPYGAHVALKTHVITAQDINSGLVPRAYPVVESNPTGKHVVLIQYGNVARRTHDELREAITVNLEAAGVPVVKFRGVNVESFREAYEAIRDAFYVIACGESDLIYVAALLGKRGIMASYDDGDGWVVRAQLGCAMATEEGGGIDLTRIKGGNPAHVTAAKIMDKIGELRPSNVPAVPHGFSVLVPTELEGAAQSAFNELADAVETTMAAYEPEEKPRRRKRRKSNEDQGSSETSPDDSSDQE